MNILVCISSVPDTTSRITFNDRFTALNTTGLQFIVNPYDEIALAKALDLAERTGGKVTVITVGDATTEPVIRKALATGADEAVRVDALPRDAWFVANQVATYAQDKDFRLILTGKESIDYNGAQLAAFVGELLGIPSVSISKQIEVDGDQATLEREIEGGREVLTIPLPVVAGTSEGVAVPRIPNMRGIMSARTKPLTVIAPVDVPTLSSVVRYETPTPRKAVTMVDAGDIDRLVALLHTEAKVI